MAGRWSGCTVACIASGPSLTADDCRLIERAGIPAIAVNTSWKLARFAQAIYAADSAWWRENIEEIDIPAERWTSHEDSAVKYGLYWHRVYGSRNSGFRAIQLAMELGAQRIILIGYDCSVRAGTHWHGDHTRTTNPNPDRCRIWSRQFEELATKNRSIINCSRYTALKCFPKQTLEDALH